MNLAGEEEKETCTGKRLRSHDSTTAWGSSSSDAADAAGETERTLTKHARRRPAGAQAVGRVGSMQHVAALQRG